MTVPLPLGGAYLPPLVVHTPGRRFETKSEEMREGDEKAKTRPNPQRQRSAPGEQRPALQPPEPKRRRNGNADGRDHRP